MIPHTYDPSRLGPPAAVQAAAVLARGLPVEAIRALGAAIRRRRLRERYEAVFCIEVPDFDPRELSLEHAMERALVWLLDERRNDR